MAADGTGIGIRASTRAVLQLAAAALLAFGAAGGLTSASAQAAKETAPIATYEAADRQARLVALAKQEGEVSLYTSLTVEDMAVLNGAFERRYGIKVRMWRASADKILQRVLTEAQAGRHDVDVIEANAQSLESLHREKLLQRVRSPHHADLIAAALPAHGEWVASRLNVFVQAYNTNQVKPADVPKSFEDLLDPRWKGKLGIEATDDDWFSVIVQDMGVERGLKLFRDLAAGNGLSVRRGHTLLTQLVASGEVPYALTVYNFTAEQLRQKGAPLNWHVLPPGVARANGVAIPRRTPHPAAALLYYDFMISDEGQQILLKRDFVPTSRKVESPLGKAPLRLVDAARVLDEGDKWARIYDEIIVKQAK